MRIIIGVDQQNKSKVDKIVDSIITSYAIGLE